MSRYVEMMIAKDVLVIIPNTQKRTVNHDKSVLFRHFQIH